MMRAIAFIMGMSVGLGTYASQHIKGHYTKRGSYVAPHFRSSPDHSKFNNWDSKGNVNPYTGKRGTKGWHTTGKN